LAAASKSSYQIEQHDAAPEAVGVVR
jgi:hypothetical protein